MDSGIIPIPKSDDFLNKVIPPGAVKQINDVNQNPPTFIFPNTSFLQYIKTYIHRHTCTYTYASTRM